MDWTTEMKIKLVKLMMNNQLKGENLQKQLKRNRT